MTKPSLFVGSSKEGLEIARAIGYQLRDDAEVTIWDEGVFLPGQAFLESLVNALDRFDFAILVLTPDDTVIVKEQKRLQPRDNLMFELGLFMGRLGRSRTFIVCPNHEDMRLPSDLAGVTVLKYEENRRDSNPTAAVSPLCVPIRDALRDLGTAETKGLKRLNEATTQVEDSVKEIVDVLLRSRIWETEVFRKQYSFMLDDRDVTQLDEHLDELKKVLAKKKNKA